MQPRTFTRFAFTRPSAGPILRCPMVIKQPRFRTVDTQLETLERKAPPRASPVTRVLSTPVRGRGTFPRDAVTAIAFSPAGRLLATGKERGRLGSVIAVLGDHALSRSGSKVLVLRADG